MDEHITLLNAYNPPRGKVWLRRTLPVDYPAMLVANKVVYYAIRLVFIDAAGAVQAYKLCEKVSWKEVCAYVDRVVKNMEKLLSHAHECMDRWDHAEVIRCPRKKKNGVVKYEHFCVFDKKRKSFYEFTGTVEQFWATKKVGCVEETPALLFFLREVGTEFEILDFKYSLSADRVIKNCRSILGTTGWHALKNCEHYARWAKTGKEATSEWTSRLMKKYRKSASITSVFSLFIGLLCGIAVTYLLPVGLAVTTGAVAVGIWTKSIQARNELPGVNFSGSTLAINY